MKEQDSVLPFALLFSELLPQERRHLAVNDRVMELTTWETVENQDN